MPVSTRPTSEFPKKIFVVVNPVRLQAYESIESLKQGTVVGVYQLVEIATQEITKTLVPIKNDGVSGKGEAGKGTAKPGAAIP